MFTVLDPQGQIALQERNLIVFAILLMLLVVIPVFILTIVIANRYRAGNRNAAYTPEHDHDLVAEMTWWAIPCIIIGALAFVTWQSSHTLDPFRPLSSSVRPITIQVVALDWKWLFIYPEQGIATINFVEFPEGTPIDFEITADAPMNSFWIPSLGSQIYAMPGMVTHLHLIADHAGTYRGMSANFSGAGFSGMTFVAQSVSRTDFDQWVRSVIQNSSHNLDTETYHRLVTPSTHVPPMFFYPIDTHLYTNIVNTYLSPSLMNHHDYNHQ
jgi:cytochrome o ubiquinol oxidase subunit 2